MIKKEALSLKEALAQFFEENKRLQVSLGEHRAVKAWQEVLGEGVSRYIKNVYFKKNILYVQLTSSVLRAELLMNKQNLMDKINDYAQMNIVKDIVIR